MKPTTIALLQKCKQEKKRFATITAYDHSFAKLFADEGLKSTGGLSNNSNGAPKTLRPIMDSALVAMAMMQGLTSAIVNPNDLRLMETIKTCDIFKNHELYSDSYLEA